MDVFQLDVFCVLICDILPYDGTSISLIAKDIKSGCFCTSWQFRRACNNLIRVMWLRRFPPEPACRAATIDQHSAASRQQRKKHGRRRCCCPQTDLRQLIRLFQLHVPYSILTIVFFLNRGIEFLLETGGRCKTLSLVATDHPRKVGV